MPDTPEAGLEHAATFGCPCGFRVRARNRDELADHKEDCDHAE